MHQLMIPKMRIRGIPITPAELPTNVPLLVTEFRTLLIRNLVFDTASGRRAPSRTPQTPPSVKPSNEGEHVTNQNNKRTKDGDVREIEIR